MLSTAQEALLPLQEISTNCSNGEYFDSELDDALKMMHKRSLIQVEKNQDVDSPSEDDDSDLQNQVQVNQDLIKKDGTAWQALAVSLVQRGRLQQQNILSFKPGPTAFAISRIIESSPLSSFCVLFDEAMLRNIRK